MNASMPWLLAGSILLAALMGFAIQRGATCTVAAVDELVNQRRAKRLVSLAEAAIWVGLGVLLARQAGLIMQVPSGHEASWRTLLGGVLLGGGAYVNRACVFGAIARWASGDWAYAATPLGFFLGSVVFLRVAQSMGSPKLMQASPAQALPDVVVILFMGLLLCRALWAGWQSWRAVSAASTAQPVWLRAQLFGARVWSPRPATIIIGLTFLGMMLMAGPWAYTELLSQWAAGMSQQDVIKILLAMALFSGAGLGGWTAGKWHWHGVQWMGIARCLAGGALMGMGSLLIPGGNDGLILVGMPMLWPYAWLAFATMCVTIASLMLLARR